MINFRRECVQIHLFYRAKRPSPSPLSHGIAFYDAAGSKMDIPYESGGGFFASLHFARDCRPFLEGCAPAVPKIGILDESGEGFSEKVAKTLAKYEENGANKGLLRTAGGRMGHTGRGNCREYPHFYA